MRSYVIDRFDEGFAGLICIDKAMPIPGPGQALVRIRAASLNYRDLVVAAGHYPPPFEIEEGIVPLSDGAGEVVEIGTNVTRVRPGDRVVAAYNQYWIGGPIKFVRTGGDLGGGMDGVLAEYVLFDQEGLVHLPDSLDYESAAALPCAGVTAWSSLTAGESLAPGDTVLVQGTGGVAIFALQLARAFGARVLAITSSREKTALLRSLGATEVVNYAEEPEWAEKIVALTGGIGVDRVIEVAGGATFAQSIRCTRPGGVIAMVGVLGGFEAAINATALLVGQLSVIGVTVGSRTALEQLVRACDVAGIAPLIDRVFPFQEALLAYRHLKAAAHRGKVCIQLPE